MDCDDYVTLYLQLCKHIKKEVMKPDEKHEVNMVLQHMKLQNCLHMDKVLHNNCERKFSTVKKLME